MNVRELINILSQHNPQTKVILAEELGAGELEESQVGFEIMNFIEYPPYHSHHEPYYGWEFPSEYDRKVIKSEKVVVIGPVA